MEACVIAKEELLLAVLPAEGGMKEHELAKDVRRAWKELKTRMEAHSPGLAAPAIGYVVYPQWNTASPEFRHKLWVGMMVRSADQIPPDVEALTIQGRKYAAAVCQGNREHMYGVYGELRSWVEGEGLALDTSEGAWTVEANRLAPVNPFDIPPDEIESFDFDILYAVK